MNSQNAEKSDPYEPAYLADYGLARVPFSESHDDRFLYLDPERAQRLNLIQHTLQYNNLLLLVKGEDGIGKTSLMTRFVRIVASDVKICVVTANPMMDAGQLLYQAAKGFDIRRLPLDSSELQGMLYEHIANLHHTGRTPVLVVDDAHTLPKDALLALYHLADAQVGGDKLVRVILFCTPQMDKILSARDMRALHDRITHNMEIPRFDEVTTAEYLKHRLAVAGFNGSSPFTPDMVKRIYKASGGIPARINHIALEMLDRGVFDREEADGIVRDSQPGGRRPYRRVIAVLVVIVALVGVIRYRFTHVLDAEPVSKSIPVPMSDAQIPPANSEIRPAPVTADATDSSGRSAPAPLQSAAPHPPTEPASEAASTDSAVQREQKIIPLHPEATPLADSTAAPATTQAATAAPASAEQVAVDQAQPAATSEQSAPAATAVPEPQIQVGSIEPSPVPASTSEQTLIVHGTGFTQNSRVYVSWADHDQEIPPQRVKYVNGQRLEVALTVGTGDAHWQLRVNDREHGNSNSLRFDVAVQPTPRSQPQVNAWVRSQNPAALTLQLFGSHDLKNIDAFIQQHQLGQQAHYFLASHNGEDWYSVVYGVYPDQAAAHEAISTLPASLSRIKPWVRRFDDIQSGIGAAHTATAAAAHKPTKPPASELASNGTAPKAGDVSQYESWIWSQDPSRYTLQLMGAHDEASIRKFLQQYQELAGRLVYFHSRHDGREWYTVIYGVYPDKQKASDAIRRLPSALQKTSPWIRKYASIHAELSRTN